MIGTRVSGRPAGSWPIGLWLLVGIPLLLLIPRDARFGLYACLPLAWAIGLWLTRGHRIDVEFSEQGLILHHPRLVVPYHSLEIVRIGGGSPRPDSPRLRPGPVSIIHAQGALELPVDRYVSSLDVYRFLWEHISVSGSRQVHMKLAEFLQHQEALFGPHLVHCYEARRTLGPPSSRRRVVVLCILTLVVGIIWMLGGSRANADDPMLVWGILLFSVGMVGTVVASVTRRSRIAGIPNWQQSSLIVSPGGLALVQGLLTGTMRWDELQSIDDLSPGSGRGGGFASGIRLRVPGTAIILPDIYDRPLPVIYDAIQQYWRPPASLAGSH